MDLMTREVADFKLYSGLLKAFETDGRKYISGIASSTVTDLHGDFMELSALQAMERSAKDNMTIWLNHEYEVPKDIFGSVADAKLSNRAQDIWDLDLSIAVNETNQRAVDTWRAIDSGTKLGLSIGALLKDFDMRKDGTYLIRDVDLLEASVVSIPANPRSWIQNAVKAAKAKRQGKSVAAMVPFTSTTTSAGGDSTTNLVWKISDGSPVEVESDDLDIANAEVIDETGEEPVIQESEVSPDLEKEVEEDSAEPPVEEAQEAPDSMSEPENADGEPEAEMAEESGDGDDDAPEEAVSNALGDLSVKSFSDVVELLRSTTSELLSTKATLMQTSAERDLAAKGFFAAMEVVQKVGDLPLARRARTPFNEAQASVERLRSIYSEKFMEILEKSNE